jgi:hypothetical protein
MSERYDLVVRGRLGGGEGAAQAAYLGKRVVVVDRLSHPGSAPGRLHGIPRRHFERLRSTYSRLPEP